MKVGRPPCTVVHPEKRPPSRRPSRTKTIGIILTALCACLMGSIGAAGAQGYNEAGGPDVLIATGDTFQAYAPSMDVAENGDIFVAVTVTIAGYSEIRVYRSYDGGSNWVLWGTIGVSGINVSFPCLHIGEGAENRIYLSYRYRGPSDANYQIWVAWSMLSTSFAGWNNRLVMSRAAVDFQSPSIHSDEMSNDSYNVYLAAMGSGSDGADIWFSRSTDFGNTWESAYEIASSTTGDGLFYPEIRYGRGGVVHCAYYFNPTNTPGKDMAVRYRRAIHYASGIGAWQPIVNLTSDTDNHHEFHASVAASHESDLVVIGYSRQDSNSVFLPGRYRYSTNGGESWSIFNGGAFTDNILPHLLAVSGTSTIASYGSPDRSDNYGVMTAPDADPTRWSRNASFMDRPYDNVVNTRTGGSYFDYSVADGRRLGAVWLVYNATGPDSLFFDAEWRAAPLGACCNGLTGGCQIVPESECVGTAGEWFAGVQDCAPNPCSPGPYLRIGDWINPEPWHDYVGPSTRPMHLEVELPTGVFPPIARVDFSYSIDGGSTWTLAGSDNNGAEPILDTFGTSDPTGDGWSIDFVVPNFAPPPPSIQFAADIQMQSRDVVHVEDAPRSFDPLPPSGMRSGIEETVVVSDDTLGVEVYPGGTDITHVYAFRYFTGNYFQKGIPGINQNQHSATSCAPASTGQCFKYYEGQGDSELTGGLSDVDLLFGLATMMRTNVDTIGTPVSSWINGTRRWVEEHGNGYTVRGYRHFTETGVSTWTQDDWIRIRDGLQRCNDVLLGLYWSTGGGHAVTLDGVFHGITPTGRRLIDFRDPWSGDLQYAEIDTASGFLEQAYTAGQPWTAFLGTSMLVAPREQSIAFGYPGDLVYDGPLPEGPPYVIPIELLNPGYYMIQLIGVNGMGHAHTLTGMVRRLLPADVDDQAPLPLALQLRPCTPNPFQAETEIAFALPAAAHATIEVYSVTGRKVRTLLDGRAEAGTHRITWDGTDDLRKDAPAGVYYIRLSTPVDRIVRSVTLIR